MLNGKVYFPESLDQGSTSGFVSLGQPGNQATSQGCIAPPCSFNIVLMPIRRKTFILPDLKELSQKYWDWFCGTNAKTLSTNAHLLLVFVLVCWALPFPFLAQFRDLFDYLLLWWCSHQLTTLQRHRRHTLTHLESEEAEFNSEKHFFGGNHSGLQNLLLLQGSEFLALLVCTGVSCSLLLA